MTDPTPILPDEIKMDKADVSVSRIEDLICEHSGDHCTFTVTHQVFIDIRNAGIKESVGGIYCETCANEIADRIRASLPNAT